MNISNTQVKNYLNKFHSQAPALLIICTLFFMGTVVMQYFMQTPDPDKIIAERIQKLQEQYANYWTQNGLPLAQAKENLYQQDQQVSDNLKKLAEDIAKDSARLEKKELLPAWTAPDTAYFKDESRKKYKVIPEDIGGAEQLSTTYTKPEDLFYTCLKADGCEVTQPDTEHFENNKYIATDVGTKGRNVKVYTPDWMNQSVEYTAKYIFYKDTTGNTVELTGEVNGVKIMWRIGHIHWQWDDRNFKNEFDGKKVKTGQVIAMSGGESERSKKKGGDQGATTGNHVHIEYLLWDGKSYVPNYYRIENSYNKHKEIIGLNTAPLIVDVKMPGLAVEEKKDPNAFDIDKLAWAVAIAETGKDGKPCMVGNAAQINNCHGIKQGNTAPCKRVSAGKKCIYDDQQESFEAFKIIWARWYKGFPTYEQAVIWTGDDRPQTWLDAVKQYYYN